MTGHLHIVPDPAFEPLKPALRESLARVLVGMGPAQFAGLLDPLLRDIIQQAFAEAGAHEGTIWLVDGAGENLVPVHNTGPQAAQFVGTFQQPLNAGLICMVFASEQPFVENDVSKNARQSKALDSLLQTETIAMLAAPFYLFGECRGVVSCVQLRRADRAGAPFSGFSPENLLRIQRLTALCSQLVEYRILRQTIGWTSE